MSKLFILPYSKASNSARLLATELGIKVIKRGESNWKPAYNKEVINWGCSECNIPVHCEGANFINDPESVSLASNKLLAFKQLNVPVVMWTTDRREAMEWNDTSTVYCRTKLTGHSGDGIVLKHKGEGIVDAPLYTKYMNAATEWRVHVVFDEVVDVRKKSKKEGVEGNKYIRNHENGYVFRMHDVNPSPRISRIAIEAVASLNLDFGAVDILMYKGYPYVLEVNTACGMEGTTVVKYANAIKRRML